jgi:hypothetical protein
MVFLFLGLDLKALKDEHGDVAVVWRVGFIF